MPNDRLVLDRVQAMLMANATKGYAGGTPERLSDGSNRIRLQTDDLVLDDTWAGGDPFGGRILISIAGRPVWIAAFYGAVLDPLEDPWAIYAFLREALRAAPAEFPVRGPRSFGRGDLQYGCEVSGTLARFHAEERIGRRRARLYEGWAVGGLVDRRGG